MYIIMVNVDFMSYFYNLSSMYEMSNGIDKWLNFTNLIEKNLVRIEMIVHKRLNAC